MSVTIIVTLNVKKFVKILHITRLTRKRHILRDGSKSKNLGAVENFEVKKKTDIFQKKIGAIYGL